MGTHYSSNFLYKINILFFNLYWYLLKSEIFALYARVFIINCITRTIYLILRKGPLSLLLRCFSEIFGQWLVSRDSSWQYVQRTRVSRCLQCLQCSFPAPRHFRPPTWKTASPTPLEMNYFQNCSYQKIFFKGQIISESHFDVLNFPNNQRKNLTNFSSKI